ncbi:MAG: hypothetical protein JW928_04395 [Candidatus Aureabacteria bacterium]|nr:hypothetical protein [Candidatus Auribacterota bacterium]
MKFRSITVALTITLIPFIIGVALFLKKGDQELPRKTRFMTDTGENNKGAVYKGIKIDWAFCPSWEYQPLFFRSEEYFVFVFHYTNSNNEDVYLMPSYSFASSGNRRYSANEEIAMYIEDGIENQLKIQDQTPMNFKISPNSVKHYLVAFEKPPAITAFTVDVDIFRDVTLRLYYKKEGQIWVHDKNEFVNNYNGRG